MSTNLQQIGTPLLDMDNVAAQLHIKGALIDVEEDGTEKYSPFVTLKDLEKAGSENSLVKYFTVDDNDSPVPISRIAVAYAPEDANVNTAIDRETVKNAKYLDGKAAAFYAAKDYCDKVNSSAETLANAINKEIADIRAEHVQLMAYIAQQGIIENYKPFAGFYDTFRKSYPVHQKDYITKPVVDSPSQNIIRIPEDKLKYFSEGDYIVVVNGTNIYDSLNRAILKIDKIQGTTLILTGYTGFPIRADTTYIYRSLGCAYKNSFAFGYFEEQHASDSKIYTGVDDDNYRTRRKIRADHTGFATTFRINPGRANGSDSYYLSSIEICAKKIGSPGPLKCYIINAINIDNFEDPASAKAAGYILAESQPLIFDNKLGEAIVEFDFLQDGQYPLLKDIDRGIDGDTGRTRFCMIIEALTADSSNYYELLFLQHYDTDTNTLSDLQMNNIVYEYSEIPSTELMSESIFTPLTTNNTINNADMFYGITLRPIEDGYFVPSDEGLYSAEFKTYEPIKVNHARLTIKVAREGYFTVASTSANTNDNVADGGTVRYVEDKSFRIAAEQSSNYNGFAVLSDQGEAENRKVIIGTHIAELDRVDGDKLIIKKGAHIKTGEPVYPMSYTASLLCYNRYWDENSQSYVTGNTVARIPLKISCVQPSYHEQEKSLILSNEKDADVILKSRLKEKIMISDNLIFEGDLDTEEEFNHFQLQIYWRSMAGKICQSYAGRIHSLGVSLNRKVFWKG